MRMIRTQPAGKILRALLSLAVTLTLARADSATNRFAFTGPEIFPIDNQIGHLRAADLDGDGLQDLIVVNNFRSKINLLYNQTGRTNQTELKTDAKRELNELPPDARFRIDSIASEKRISSLVVADLNGDGKPDIAYYGEPKELVVQFNQGTNGWSAPKRWPLDDGLLEPDALTSGDLNGDGRPDLVLLAENYVYLLVQTTNHTLAEPEKIPYSGTVKSPQVLDIDGDGREDVLLVNFDSPNPFRFRLQNETGQLGPEIHFSLPPIRSYWADDLDGDHKTEIITIAQKSGRAQVSTFKRKPAEPLSGALKEGQFQVLPLTRTSKARRGAVWADIDGDGLPELLVAEPDSGQLAVYFQGPDGSLGSPKKFPTLTGVSDVAVADWDGDGRPEIFLLSADERQVGVTQLDKNGRVAFPRILPTEGRPLALAVGALQPGAKPSLALILDKDDKRELQVRSADGKIVSQKLSESFKSNPTTLAFHDVNQDGLNDLVVLIPYEKIKVLVQVRDKPFDEQDIAPPGGSAEQPWMSAADVDGDGKPELLLAQKNFLRAVVWQVETNSADSKPTYSFRVKEQINGASSNSRIVAAAALPNGTNRIASLFLLDAERKTLTLCERDPAGVWQVVRNLPLPVSDFSSLQAVALGATRPNSIAFLSLNAAAWMTFTGEVWEFAELDGYETPIKDGYLNDVVSGDLNNDGRKDLVFLETAKNYLELVTFEPPHQLAPASRWQVFEERTFRGRRNELPEPREALITDVTGDGKNDLVVLVHDRILVYPQE
ncbi:MAG TPA: VCBS repeat-containing protein [Candidatus Angelobacter sp.]|nr:VCBS repeat-containing protein [Candidatus Angelobacter sp.]